MNPAEESRKRRNYDAFQSSTDRSISPPPKRHASHITGGTPGVKERGTLSVVNAAAPSILSADNSNEHFESTKEAKKIQSRTYIQSPVQLNFIEQLPTSSNVDCISLGSILGDPMIKECWLFNYLFDIDFVM